MPTQYIFALCLVSFTVGVMFGIGVIAVLSSGKTEDLYNEVYELQHENEVLKQELEVKNIYNKINELIKDKIKL